MFWLYLFAAALIAWGLFKDLTRGETWMIFFGRILLREKPRIYWLTIGMRGLLFLAIIVAAFLRVQA